MRIPLRDAIASVLVAIGVVVYLTWLTGFDIPGLRNPTGVTIAILILGVAASMSAVVPGFNDLLRGSRLYLVSASTLGLVALGAGIFTISGADAYQGLAVLTLSTVILWGMSTLRHAGAGRPRQELRGPLASPR